MQNNTDVQPHDTAAIGAGPNNGGEDTWVRMVEVPEEEEMAAAVVLVAVAAEVEARDEAEAEDEAVGAAEWDFFDLVY